MRRIESELTKLRRSTAARIARLSKEQALDVLRRVRERGNTIDQPAIRELSGGPCSQSFNAWVVRKVAHRAGMIPKGASC